MDKLVFSCFLLGGLTPDPGPTNSCDVLNTYCTAGVTNVGCNPPPATGGSACDGLSPQVIDLLAAEQTYILSYINQIRNSFSSGQYRNTKANRMFALQWDANLATQAGNNARSCVMARDACRNTADFRNVGQLIASYTGLSEFLASSAVTQKLYYVLSNILFFTYSSGTISLSSYSASTNTENQANILNDRSTMVGCALMQWDDQGLLYLYLVCNFSANVIEGQPLFTTAATTGLGCTTKDTTYTSLCLT